MDKTSVDWHGPMPAVVTPFDAEGRIDEAAFRANLELCIDAGMTGLVVGGCTGEFWAMTADERIRIMEIGVETALGRVPVIGGATAVTTSEAIQLTRMTKDVGCMGAMLLPPYFVRPGKDDIVAHFEAVSEAVELPLMLYNLPAGAVDLTADLVDRLADVDTVVAIKDSTLDFNSFYKTLTVAGDRIRVFMGRVNHFGLAAVELGVVGFVSSSPNYWGREFVDFYQACEARDRDRARGLAGEGAGARRLDGRGRAQPLRRGQGGHEHPRPAGRVSAPAAQATRRTPPRRIAPGARKLGPDRGQGRRRVGIRNMSGILNGKVAVVTGAGAGIGEAIARLYAEHGCRVVVADRAADAAERVAGGSFRVGGHGRRRRRSPGDGRFQGL